MDTLADVYNRLKIALEANDCHTKDIEITYAMRSLVNIQKRLLEQVKDNTGEVGRL